MNSPVRLLRRAVILCGIACIPVAFSLWIDPERVLGAPDAERAIARALADGHHVTDVMNYDDRAIERQLASMRRGAADVLAIGSSRMQPLTRQAFPVQRFVNISVSGGRLDDFLGLYSLYRPPARRPRRVLLALDPWTLNADSSLILWAALARERSALLDTLGVPHSVLRDRLTTATVALKRIGSPSFFRLAVFSLRHYGVGGIRYTVTESAQNAGKTKAPDGSLTWVPTSPDDAERFARRYVAEVRLHAAEYDGTVAPSAGALVILERLLAQVRRDGVMIEIVLLPFHPLVYAELASRPASKIREVELTYREIARRTGVHVIGSYDPVVTGMAGSDFFDESHMRPASLARLIGR